MISILPRLFLWLIVAVALLAVLSLWGCRLSPILSVPDSICAVHSASKSRPSRQSRGLRVTFSPAPSVLSSNVADLLDASPDLVCSRRSQKPRPEFPYSALYQFGYTVISSKVRLYFKVLPFASCLASFVFIPPCVSWSFKEKERKGKKVSLLRLRSLTLLSQCFKSSDR